MAALANEYMTEIYFLTVLEARIPKISILAQNQGIGRAVLPPKFLGENPCLFQFLVPSIPRFHDSNLCLCLHMAFWFL